MSAPMDSTVKQACSLMTLQFRMFYQNRSAISPLTQELIEDLIQQHLYDAKYHKNNNGLRGLYEAQLEFFAVKDDHSQRPITCLYVAYVDSLPVGVAAVTAATGHVAAHADNVFHVYVKPEYRRNLIGRKLLGMLMQMFPHRAAMARTELSAEFFHVYPNLIPIHQTTPLERDYQRCLRTLRPDDKWINQKGTMLIHSDIVETLEGMYAEIQRLRRQFNPNDKTIYPF